jgi:hypothetical protein
VRSFQLRYKLKLSDRNREASRQLLLSASNLLFSGMTGMPTVVIKSQ